MKSSIYKVVYVFSLLLFVLSDAAPPITGDSGGSNAGYIGSCELASVASRTIYAGRHINIGTLKILTTSKGITLYIQLNQWLIRELHIYVAKTPPLTSAPGQFPYKFSYRNDPVAYVAIPIDLDTSGCSADLYNTLYIAVHMDAISYGKGGSLGQETAWAWGENQFSRGWGWWFKYQAPCCRPQTSGSNTYSSSQSSGYSSSHSSGSGGYTAGNTGYTDNSSSGGPGGQECDCTKYPCVYRTFNEGDWGCAYCGNQEKKSLETRSPSTCPAACALTDEYFNYCFNSYYKKTDSHSSTGGLVIGCPYYNIRFTNKEAVRKALPGDWSYLPEPLKHSYVNPERINPFAGAVLSAALNIKLDRCIPEFGPSCENLGDLQLCDAMVTYKRTLHWNPCINYCGKTFDQVLEIANNVLGGCRLVTNKEFNELFQCVTFLSQSFSHESGNTPEQVKWVSEQCTSCGY